MMTKRQAQAYSRKMTASRNRANDLGLKLGKQIKDEVGEVGEIVRTQSRKKKIDPIFVPLVLEPILSSLDDAYDTLGQSNFEWTIDLYIGRKCAKIIPLLLKIAEKLTEAENFEDNKAEGGGPDHYMWIEKYSVHMKDCIAMRWDTQSRSYYITLTRKYGQVWKLDVAEYKWKEERQNAPNSWSKEPGHVLQYEMHHSYLKDKEFQIDENRVENAWLNLPRIRRFFDLVNPCCTALDINLYETRIRSQVVVTKIENNNVELMIMGRNLEERAVTATSDLPLEVRQVLAVDKILHAVTNLGTKNVKDLIFTNWETE